MTLRTRHIRPQKGRQQIRNPVQRHLRIPQQKTRRPVLAQPPVRRQHLPHQFIPRPVHRNLRLQPVLVKPRLRTLRRIILHPQHVRHPVEQIHRRSRRMQQRVNQPRPLVHPTIRQKRLHLRPHRYPARDVHIKPPHQHLIPHRSPRLAPRRLQRPLNRRIQSRRRRRHHLCTQRLPPLPRPANLRHPAILRSQRPHRQPHHRPIPLLNRHHPGLIRQKRPLHHLPTNHRPPAHPRRIRLHLLHRLLLHHRRLLHRHRFLRLPLLPLHRRSLHRSRQYRHQGNHRSQAQNHHKKQQVPPSLMLSSPAW